MQTGLQLLASLEAVTEPKAGIEPMPALFLEEFANRQNSDLLQELLKPICPYTSLSAACDV